MPQVNRFLEALKESSNIIGLSTAATLSMALLNPIPLLVGFAVEAAYLLFVPDSKWYEARLSRRFEAEVVRRRRELRDKTFPLLHAAMQERFLHLDATRNQIYAQAKDDQKWFMEVLRKLDYLLEKFLMFAVSEAQFRGYLSAQWQAARSGGTGRAPDGNPASVARTSNQQGRRPIFADAARREVQFDIAPARGVCQKWVPQVVEDVQTYYQTDIDKLTQDRDADPDENSKAILQKRIEVLQQRHEFSGKIGRILINLNNQMELLEDTFGLINDQIRARSPEQVLSDIEGVVYQTDSMTRLLEELAPYEQMTAGVSS
jgi:hypothetical protein